MVNLDLAVARIRNRAIQLPAHKRAAYVGENIAHQQRQHDKFVNGRAPADWSSAQSIELIRRLVDLQLKLRESELEAA